nr:PREDICTED: pre-mRNA cleavage complex 2 protein Pcf11 isoform X1 [Latimeria chalumnae]|eukprot:XP_006001893.1 PREDICTED: pre-mRNA cleavage complex 2 protein Pcf11 isoform X1 [Latimeria chalumnae]
MSEDAAKEDACGEYQSSLEDLTFNSKPHINMLTILAEENLQFAKDIVTLIEAQIAKAPASEKLPVMYLMDSIVKNVGREYLAAFTKNLVSTFVCVFEKVDENTRKSLFKLRSTWDEIFPVKKLYALDVRVNTVDPAWPIKPLPPNVNTSSIHVNPKFLSKSPEDPTPPSPVVNAPVIPAPTNVPDLQKNLTQEQVIRQQLLAKQKQLLELQQKKIELELEQTKAQLAVSLAAQQGSGTNLATPPIPPKLPVSSANPPVGANKSSHQVFVPQEKNRPLQLQSSRDPRLNRLGQQASHGKDQGQKKSPQISASHQIDSKPNKNPHTEKPTSKHEKKPDKLFKKEPEVTEEKNKSKLPSPLKNKSTHLKDVKSPDVESTRAPEINKRDPRLRKHLQDKTDDKDDETKEKRKCSDKRERDHKQPSEHRPVGNRNKFINGNYQKQEKDAEALERQSSKQGRSSGRKRSRSQSRSPVAHSPKRRERRSPKRRQKSISPPLSSKLGKMRQTGPKQSHSDGFVQCAITREERNPLKKGNKPDPRDPRRLKRIPEERFPESVDSHSAKLLSEPKENIENWQGSKPPKRWKSGWEENKSSQQSKDHQGSGKPAHQRHRDSWSSNKGIMSPRVLKHHRLSVDDNLQIPKELTSASKRDLLKKANERLASGEITQDDFLVVAHQINQLFQYQEEKHRSGATWNSPTEETKGGLKKKPLLPTPPMTQMEMSDAVLTYYEHKSKLKRTQVQPFQLRLDQLESEEILHGIQENDHNKGKYGGRVDEGQFSERPRRHSPVIGSRPYSDNPAHDSRKKHDEQMPPKGIMGSATYEQGGYYDRWGDSKNDCRESHRQQGRNTQEFQKPGRNEDGGFCSYDDPEETNKFGSGGKEDQRPHYNERFTQDRSQFEESNDPSYKEGSGPRFEGPKGNQRFGGTAEEMRPRFEGPPDHSGGRFEGSPRLIGQRGDGLHSRLEGPSGPRFDGPPNHPDTRIDGPQGQQAPQRFDGPPRFEEPQGQQGPPRFEGPLRFEGPQGPQGPPRLEGPQGPPRLEGPQGPPRLEGPQGPPRLEGPPGLPRLEGPQGQQGPLRFEGPQGQQTLQRFEGLQVQQVPPRFEGLQVLQGLSRFEGPPGQQAPPRFEGPSNLQGLSRFEGPPGQQAPPRFEGPPSQQAPLRFEGIPGQQTPPRFEGPPGPLGPRFERQQAFSGPSLQGLPRFDGGLIQSGSRFEGPHVLRFDGPPSQAHIMSRFDGVHGQRFDRPPGQQTPPRFEGPLSQQPQLPPNFDATPNHSVPRLDVQGQPGLVFDNVPNQSGPRLESTHFRNFNLPCGQGGPIFNESLNHTFNGPPQGMSFQRPSESRFDVSQVHSFNAPPVTGGPNLANPLNPGPYQNLQGASLGNFSSIPASAPVGNIPPPQSASVMSGLNQTVSFSQGQQFITPQSQSSVTFMQNQPGPSFVHPENHLGQLDVNELFAKLLSTGILQVTQADSASTQSNEATAQPQPAVEEEEEDDQSEDQDIPDLTSFTIEDMKQRYDSVINRLYTGIQCYSCGMRFTTSQTDVYADHLDWHFRQNRTEKDVSKKVTHRRWYYSLTDWIEFEEIADLEERAKSQFFEKVHEEVILKTQEAAKEKEFPSVPAGPAGVDECCEICEEQFEQYWDEEEEEWHLKNAMRVDEKIYHPTCYEDYKKTSSFLDSTPSPSKAPVENPLNAMLDTVKQEPTETFSTCQIKQEVTDPFSGCSEENKCSSKDIKTEPDEKEPV